MQTMGDFTNMSESLSLMPDTALQQFAQMHRDDPFTLSLAVSESNRRKKLRTAQQGVAGMQQQPPVADQEIAQMNAAAMPAQPPAMPENVGIGALAAPNMQMPAGGITGEEEQAPAMMAGGGMVAFAGGGDVERYQSDGLVQPQPRPGESFADFRRRIFQESLAAEQAQRQQEYAASEVARQRAVAERGGAAIPPSPYGIQRGPLTPSGITPSAAAAETMEQQRARNMAQVMASPSGPRNSPGMVLPSAAEQLALAAKGEEIPITPATTGAPPPATTGAGAPPTPPRMPAGPAAGGIGDVNAMLQSALTKQKYEDPAKADIAKLGQTLESGAKRRLEEFDTAEAKQGDVFKGREARIAAREGELGKQKDTNTGLAFLNAGLAIMSTPGGLATAIGKGARVGTEQFAAGLDKIRSAQDRLEEAKDKVEELRLNRADMTAKERRSLTADIDKAKADVLKLSIEGTRTAAGVTEKRAAEIVGNQVKVGIAQFEQQGRMAAANAPGAQERMFTTLGGGDMSKGLKAYAEIMGPEAKGSAALLQKFATPEGQISLRMMEASSDPQQKALATSIRSALQAQMLNPMDRPTGTARP